MAAHRILTTSGLVIHTRSNRAVIHMVNNNNQVILMANNNPVIHMTSSNPAIRTVNSRRAINTAGNAHSSRVTRTVNRRVRLADMEDISKAVEVDIKAGLMISRLFSNN